MQTKKTNQFYFRASDLLNLLQTAGTEHVLLTVNMDDAGTTAYVEAYDAVATSKGDKPGCPWPCGGATTTITPESLANASNTLSGNRSK